MTTPDLLYVAFIAIVLFLDHFALWRTFLRRSQVDPGQARVWLWSRWMGMLWVLVAAGIGLWIAEGRAWESLGLTLAHGWRLWGGIGLVLLVAITYARTVIRIARAPLSQRIRLRGQFGNLAIVLPQTISELGWFWALSLTAGFCEEFIFRGYLIWVFQPVLGLWGAAALSVAMFAAGHAYQGVRGVLTTGVVGILLTAVVLGSGSLYPAIALHALIDVAQGLLAWLILRESRTGENGAAAPGKPA